MNAISHHHGFFPHTGGFGSILPPHDVLADVFTADVCNRWRDKPADNLTRRLNILAARGSGVSNDRQAVERRGWRAWKAAWETYLYTAFACGLLEGHGGADLRRRLANRKEEQFLAAMAECMACWFLAGKHRLPLSVDAPGRNGRNLEMQVAIGGMDTGVEVKAPYEKTRGEEFSFGDDTHKISRALKAANNQFRDDQPNILIIAPSFHRPVFSQRNVLVKAAFGQSKMTWQVNLTTGQASEPASKFFPDGRFLNTTTSKGATLKPDGLPGYRRVSALVCLEEEIRELYPHPSPLILVHPGVRSELWPAWVEAREQYFRDDNRAWVEHNVLVLHNPHAYHSISQEAFKRYPQLVPTGDVMSWTDGKEVIV
jgi:hypothetical protein